MNYKKIIFGTSVIIFGCTPLPPSNTNNTVTPTKSTSTTTSTTKPVPVKADPVYEKYNRNPNSAPILGLVQLKKKPLFESIPTTDVANVYRMKLKSATLEDIKSLSKFYNLQELNLSYGDYSELPKELFQLKNLTSLEVASTKIKTIPYEIANLDKLRSLNLSVNGIYTCDLSAVKKLTSLKVLTLKNGCIRELPDFSELNKLEEFRLMFTKVKEIPASITQCAQLRLIVLDKNKELTVLPNDLKNNKGLEIIAKRNNIDASKCRGLLEQKRVGQIQLNPAWGDYSYNWAWKELETYPTQVFDLYFANMPDEDLKRMWALIPTLVNLTDINGKLPKGMTSLSLEKMTNLNELEITIQGDLTLDISKGVRLKKLKVAGKHNLTLNTSSNVKLESMDLGTTGLTINQAMTVPKVQISSAKIPADIAKIKMESLSLYIFKDQIVCPSNWASVQVDTFKLGEAADIRTIPNSFCSNTYIKELDLISGDDALANVSFTGIPTNITSMTGLRSLRIPMTSIPPVVYKLTQLEKLELRRTEGVKKFVIPADIKSLVNLKVFTYYTFMGLGTIVIDPAFYTLPKLEELTLHNCRKSMSVEHFELSEDVSKLNLKKLAVNTPFKIPSSVWTMPNLERLEIFSLKEPVKVSSISLPKLQYFEIEDPGASLPIGQLKNLTHLNYNVGSGTSVDDVFTLTKLNYLYLYNHKFTFGNLNKLKNLEELSATRCVINDASNTSIDLPKLKILKASGCSLTKVPEFKNDGLEVLNLTSNKGIVSLSDSFYEMTKLRKVYFSYSGITTVDRQFEGLTSLNRIEFKKTKMNADGKKWIMNLKRSRTGLLTSVYF